MPLKVIDRASGAALELEEIKSHLNVNHNLQDSLLEFLGSSVTLATEQYLNRTLVWTKYEFALRDKKHRFKLSHPPLVSVEKVKVYDGEQMQILDEGDYDYDKRREPGIVRINDDVNIVQPSSDDLNYAALVTYVAGYTEEKDAAQNEAIPDNIKLWMLNVVGTFYLQRETIRVGTIVRDMRNELSVMIGNERVYTFM